MDVFLVVESVNHVCIYGMVFWVQTPPSSAYKALECIKIRP